MPKYDFNCVSCDEVQEHNCHYEERNQIRCAHCATLLEPLFSPPTQIRIPESFRHSFGELFGTSSEKDYRKDNPNLEIVNPSGADNSERAKARRERERTIKEGLDVEKVLLAQGKLKRPITTEAGSTDSDV